MKMYIHDISKIKLNDATTNKYSSTRLLCIYSDEGEFEIQLFSEDINKLKVFNLFEDESV
jgi:hypothetical protein